MWEDHLPAFAAHFRVIAPDSRGHGRTPNPADTLSYRLLAGDVAALIGALDLEHPYVCGYSDGGQAALEFGMRYAGLARAIVVGAAWHQQSESYLALMSEAGILGPGEVDWNHYPPDARVVSFYQRTHLGNGEPDYWRTFLRHLATLWMTPLNHTPADFARVTDPTLIILGDRDDTVPVQQAVDMYRMLPNAQMAVLPNAGHMDVWDSPRFVEMVREFLLQQ